MRTFVKGRSAGNTKTQLALIEGRVTFENLGQLAEDSVPSVTVRFEVASYTVAEGATTSVRIILSEVPERSLTIPLSTSRQQGISLDDYSGVPSSVSFDASETETTFTFAATQDHIDDDGEGLRIGFGSSLPEGVSSVNPMQAIVLIDDDDTSGISLTPPELEILEGKSSSYDVVLNSQPTHDVTITINSPQSSEILALQSRLTFKPSTWNMSQSVTVFANPDRDKVNDTGTITHSIDSLDNSYGRVSPPGVLVTIVDDDVTEVIINFGESSYSVAEGGTTSVEAILNVDPQRTLAIPIIATGVGGATTADFMGIPDSVTFDAGDTRQSFTMSATSDAINDDEESVRLEFGMLAFGVSQGSVGETTVHIADDDVPVVSVNFEEPTYNVQEGSGVSIRVTLNAPPERSIAIPIVRTDLGGATTTDYTGVPGSVVFGAADTEYSFTFLATQDSLDDDGESVKLALANFPDGVIAGTTTTAIVSIDDDDVPSVEVSFEQAMYSVIEGATTSVKVSLSADPKRSVSFALLRSPQGGISLDDYSGIPDSIAFDSGETEHSFVVTATGDHIDDDGEALRLSFRSPLPSDVTLGAPSEVTISIVDDDTAGVTVEPSVLRVEERATTSYSVVLNSQPTHDVTITINAPSGAKVVTDKPRLTFTPSDWHMPQRVTVTANRDRDTDDDEVTITHTVDSSDGKYEAITPSNVIVTVIDKDVIPVTVSFGQASYNVAEGASTTVKVVLDKNPERSVAIPILTSLVGGATSADYSGVPDFVELEAGQTESEFTFTAAQDSVNDDDESVTLTLGALPDGVTEGDLNEATVNIVDDEVPAVTVSFERNSYAVVEGSTTTITIVLDKVSERTLSIPISQTHQGGATSADYMVMPNIVQFSSVETERAFIITAAQDAVDDDGEAVLFTFGELPGGVTEGAFSVVTVNIVDDDVPSVTVRFEQDSYAVVEGATTTIRVLLDKEPERTLSIPIFTTHLNGATSADYSGVPTEVVFEAGEAEKSFPFLAVQDALDDDGESVLIHFGELPTGATAGAVNDTIVSIVDDDLPSITVSFRQPEHSVAEGATTTITIVLDKVPERTVTIPISQTRQGGATAADYSVVPESVNFNAIETEKAFTFTAVQDLVDDDGESIKLAIGDLPEGVTPGTRAETIVTIVDDDVPLVTVSFEQSALNVAEGSTTTIAVMLDRDPERTVAIPVAKIHQGGATNADYNVEPGMVVIMAGETKSTITFSALQDSLDDDGESIKLTFGDLPHGVAAGTKDEVSVSIDDDDVPLVNVSFEQVMYSVTEGATTSVRVSLSADPERFVTFRLMKSPQGGISLDDYSGIPESILFDSGETEHTFVVSATGDHIDDDGEALQLSFGSPLPTGVSVGIPSEAAIHITDDDTAGVTVEPSMLRVEEQATTSYAVMLNSQPTHDVTIMINSPSGAKIVADKARLTFTSIDWHMPQRVTVTANRDRDADDYEGMITHTIDSSDGKYESITPKSVMVTVIDNDVPSVTVSFGQAAYSVAEGATTTVRVVLDKAPERAVTIPVLITLRGGATSADFTGVPDFVAFDAIETESTFILSATQDAVDDDDEAVILTFGELPESVTAGAITQAAISIVDDDVPSVAVSFGQANYSVAEGSTTTVKVSLDNVPERAVSIPIVKFEQEGASSDDYIGVPDSVSFSQGETEREFTFTANEDAVDDDGESVRLTFGDLPHGVSTGLAREAVVNIIDDDAPSVTISFEQDTYSVAEGATTTLNVLLDIDPEQALAIPLHRADRGGATAADYSGMPDNIVFVAGQTVRSFTFSAIQDHEDDDGESVRFTFGNLPDFVSPGTTTSAIVNILDDDAPTVSVSFERATYSVLEGATTSVRVILSAEPERAVIIKLNRSSQGGVSLDDYSGVPESIAFDAGETEHSFVVSATGDDIDDDGEALLLSFGSPMPTGVSVGTHSEAVVHITDDDTAGVTVEPSILRVEERATTSYTVVLDSQPTHEVTITINSPPGAKIVTDKARLTYTPADWHTPAEGHGYGESRQRHRRLRGANHAHR